MIKQVFDAPPRRAAHVTMSSVRRHHRRDVARWALANGHPLNRDALAVITATREMNPDGSISTTWSCLGVESLLAWEAESWCLTHRVPFPTRVEESVRSYVNYLDRNRLLGSTSDSLEDLLGAVEEYSVESAEATGRNRHPTSTEPASHHRSTQHRSTQRRNQRRTATDDNLIHLIPKKSSISSSPS